MHEAECKKLCCRYDSRPKHLSVVETSDVECNAVFDMTLIDL